MKRHPTDRGFFIDRQQTIVEDIFNVIIHVIGLIFSLIAFVVLYHLSIEYSNPYKVISSILFSLGLIFMYSASIIYHSFSRTPFKPILKTIDHIAIYTTIAGSYSPFLMVNLRYSLGFQCLTILWSLAFFGIIFKFFFINRFRVLSLFIYLAMGWMGLIIIDPLLRNVALWGILWLLIGGAFYTLGAIFYMWESPLFSHTIWHIFVFFGSVCHFIAVLFYVIPSIK